MSKQTGENTMTFRDSKEAFAQAIRDGRLSVYYESTNYAGAYMYMGTDDSGRDLFKNIETRCYDV
jgi:ABC-type dipeptide/oligopeptide/nickel transport system permease subunit